MRSAIRQILLVSVVKPKFEASLKTNLSPEKALFGAASFARSSASTFSGFKIAAVTGAAQTLQNGLIDQAKFSGARCNNGIELVTNPYSTKFSPDGAFVYITNSSGNTVSQFSRNVTTGLLSALSPATVATGTTPRFLAISEDGASVYITNSVSNSISQFSRNVSSGLLTALSPATVATGAGPRGIAIAPDGTSVYVANNSGSTISQYSRNVSSGLLTALSPATVATGAQPYGVVVAPDGTSVYLANQGGNNISQYSRNLSTGLLTAVSPATVAAGNTPFRLTIAPDGTSVYVANSGNNNISQYSRNLSTGLLTALSPAAVAAGTSVFDVVVAPDGTSAYCTNFDVNSISQYSRNVSTGLLTNLISSLAEPATGAGPRGIAIAPNGGMVIVANATTGTDTVSVYKRNSSTGALTPNLQFFVQLNDGAIIPEDTLKGILIEGSRTNIALWTRDLTNAAWVKSTMTVAKNETGIDGTASTASKLTATSTAATVLQTVSLASSVRIFSAYVKRITGTGVISITTDNGSTWTDITSSLNNSTFTRVSISQTVTNPVFGLKIGTSGDVIAVDYVGNQDGEFISSPIMTTTTAQTRSADVLSYPATNLVTAAGIIKLDFTPEHAPVGSIFLFGTYVDANNYTAILHDATNLIARKRISGTNYDATIANAFTSGTTYKLAMSWGVMGINLVLNGALGTAHSNITEAQIGTTFQLGSDGNGASQCYGEIKNVKLYRKELKLSKLLALTS